MAITEDLKLPKPRITQAERKKNLKKNLLTFLHISFIFSYACIQK